jgi:hypothetical protein
MFRILGLSLAFAVIISCLSACEGDKSQPQDPNKVSTIPWNRPETWEGSGGMGGMMPGTP